MEDRINKLLKYKKMSASQFADLIGVQRSSISHVLSGRNKPSLDFVTKIIVAFPELNTDWLLTGMGNMLLEDSNDLLKTDTKPDHKILESETVDMERLEQKFAEIPKIVNKKEKAGRPKGPTGNKSIDKIVIFYSDGTFSDYAPGS